MRKIKSHHVFQISVILILVVNSVLSINSIFIEHPQYLGNHKIIVDAEGKILSWISPQSSAYDRVINISWDFIKNKVPIEPCGLPGYMVSSSYSTISNIGNASYISLNMAGLFGKFVESVVPYYGYTGDWSFVEIVQKMFDFALRPGVGLTPDDWAWPNMPYAWSPVDNELAIGNLGNNIKYSGRIEPDKSGEFGLGLLKLYELTNNVSYLNAALDIADVLALNVRDGNATHSPWPFRVLPQTGQILVEYCGNVVGELNLLDALIELNIGNTVAYTNARDKARSFILNHVVPNNDWRNYFEDYGDNRPTKSEYNADETARYIMDHRDWDPDWQIHVKSIWTWVENILGIHRWEDYGVIPIMEQTINIYYGEFSHTARHASVKAQFAYLRNDENIKKEAYRLFNWATYAAQPETGFVRFSANIFRIEPNTWYTDGHADYIRLFMIGLGYFPEWAPYNENHLVNSRGIVTSINYTASDINYTVYNPTFDPFIDTLRVNFVPSQILGNTTQLLQRSDLDYPGYTLTSLENGDYILKIQHTGFGFISIQK
jgi:hypothetical protein